MAKRGENPLSLNQRGARYGAFALALGLAILAWPVVQGYGDGSAGRAAPLGDSGWDEMRRFGWEMATERTQ
ncbi:hypothetical protein [Jannaschia sp. M317]|uniref:hypothetical protein n=1 Tax=Jannaschia sp. M317 TaxID=2867011 RepID=UPI0021A88F17|nr:hypothetical protein [Jannaschia sp. M317]UWQ19334.1 hypothetical protein K3551_08745 [Jannaschia sp. M317]